MSIELHSGNSQKNESVFGERLNQYKEWIVELRDMPPEQKIRVTYMGRESSELIGDMGNTIHPLKEMQDEMTNEKFIRLLSDEVSRLEEIVAQEKTSGQATEEDTDPYSGGAEEPYLSWNIVK